MFLKSDDDEEKVASFDKMAEELKKGLAEELDTSPEFISDKPVDTMAELFMHMDAESVLNDEGKAALGLGSIEPDEDEDEEEEEAESSFTSS